MATRKKKPRTAKSNEPHVLVRHTPAVADAYPLEKIHAFVVAAIDSPRFDEVIYDGNHFQRAILRTKNKPVFWALIRLTPKGDFEAFVARPVDFKGARKA
jgi:hypothetical protein